MGGHIFLILFLWSALTRISTSTMKFPENFTFATATSSYQIEGAWNVDGKGESVWDRMTHTTPNITKDGTNADDAAKSYYFYKNDIDLLKEIGFQMYRFSISWTRILPNGDLSKINQAGIKHYNDMINYMVEKNIQPMVTIYHWDLPQKLQDIGGWLNSSIVDHITNYADLLFQHYGDRVKWWLTMNEPYLMVGLNPTYSSTPNDYKVVHNVLIAHMRTYRLYERKYKTQQKGKITISLDYETCIPKTQSEEDKKVTERYFQFQVGIFAHPIFSTEGGYPEMVRNIVNKSSQEEGYAESRLPVFTEEEKSLLKGTYDYFSLNHYTSFTCTLVPPGETLKPDIISSFINDSRVKYENDPTLPTSEEYAFVINPKAFRLVLNEISRRYNYPEIFVTENGYADHGQLNDHARIDYFRSYLTELLNAYHHDKCNIIGYTVFSLLDGFEWIMGYRAKYGLTSVDFNSTNRTRTRKKSSYYLQKLISTKEIPPS